MNKKRLTIIWLLAALLVLSGCTVKLPATAPQETQIAETTVPTEETAPQSLFPDGNPTDVTCKGSYTGEISPEKIAATVGDEKLTVGELQAYYWAEVAKFRESGDQGPDFSLPLEDQACTLEEGVNTWQQYFLKQALDTWHTVEALNQVSLVDPIHRDENYNPNYKNHEKYLADKPILPILYGYYTDFRPNSQHQAYLDSLPQLLEELAADRGYDSAEALAQEGFGTTLDSLLSFAQRYNRAYMYLTYLSYYVETSQELADAYYQEHQEEFAAAGFEETDERYVNLRHIYLPAGDEGEQTAAQLDQEWQSALKNRVQDFAEQANWHSQDTGTRNDGGAYYRLLPGQMAPELDAWAFAPERAAGDHTILSLEDGVHMLYFMDSTPVWQAVALDRLTVSLEQQLITDARERFPIRVTYRNITLGQGRGEVSGQELLYPDVAHERYPEVPVYLQQDFLGTWFGGYPVHTHGCGITTMAMLATYMTDQELTVPIMCERFGGRYSLSTGTDGMIFINEPKGMGFYMIQRTYNDPEAYAALEKGYIVVSLQKPGYWTSGGHYLVLEKLNEDGTVQVRDSNTFNYYDSVSGDGRVKTHLEDRHPWSSIVNASNGYWVFDYKVTRIPLCQRCGDPEQTQGTLVTEYLCHKCRTALLRREAFLSMA